MSKLYANDASTSVVLAPPSIAVSAQCSVSGGSLAAGYSFAPVETSQISLGAGTPLVADTAVTITNSLQAPVPAEIRFTKRWLNDSNPSRLVLALTISVSAQCSVTGLHSLSFPSASGGRMAGLVVGETCQIREAAIDGGALSGGYAFEATANAQISLAANEPLSALTEVTLSNPLLVPGAAALSLRKLWTHDAVPSRVLTPPIITVQALCSISGLKTVSFSAAENAHIGGLAIGQTCANTVALVISCLRKPLIRIGWQWPKRACLAVYFYPDR